MEIFQVVDSKAKWDLILNDVFYKNLWRLGGLYAVFMLLLFLMVFILTHRYYGPLVSIDRFLRELKKGNYQARISLRKRDELQSLVRELNSLAESLEQKKGS